MNGRLSKLAKNAPKRRFFFALSPFLAEKMRFLK